MLMESILAHLDNHDGGEIMLKLSLPTEDNFYAPLVDHAKVMRVVALSGGYSRNEANEKLARNRGIIASFSRALTEGLSDGQSDEEFNATIAETIDSIHAASVAG
jgi:fructose-bisphosphate aldolase class I